MDSSPPANYSEAAALATTNESLKMATQPTKFELGEADSDENEHSVSSGGSRVGRSSGLATPKMNVVNFDGGAYFENSGNGSEQGIGLGLHHVGMSSLNAF